MLNSELIKTAELGTLRPTMAKDLAPDSQVAVGERLELIRAAMDIENQILADQIGVSAQKWNNYKAGRNMIPIPTAGRLCMVTGATLDFIYRGERAAISGVLAEKLRRVEGPTKPHARRA